MRFLILIILLSCTQVMASGPEPLFPVRQGGLWGYINREGKMIIQPRFLRADPFESGAGLARVLLPGNKPAAIDRTGQIRFTTDAPNLRILTDSLLAAGQDAAWGLYSITGTELLPRQYERFYPVTKSPYWIARKKDKCALLRRNGLLVLPPDYDSLSFSDTTIHTRNGKLTGRCLLSGKLLIPCVFDSIQPRLGGFFCKSRDKWGFYDNRGTELLPCQFVEIKQVGTAFLKARTTSKGPYRILARRNGKLLPDTTWLDFEMLDSSHVIVRNADGRGLLRMDGQLIIPARYTGISRFTGDIFAVSLNGKLGLFSGGQELLPPQYDQIGTPVDGIALITSGKLWGAISIQGKELIPPRYDNISLYENTAKAWRGNSMDLYTMDAQGRVTDIQRFRQVMQVKVTGRDTKARQSTFDFRPIPRTDRNSFWSPYDQGTAGQPAAGRPGSPRRPVTSGWYMDTRSGKWGLNDRFGRRRLNPAFNDVWHFPDQGLTLVRVNNNTGSVTVDQENYYFSGLYGLVDDSAYKMILPAAFLHIDLDPCFTKGTNMIRALHSSGTFTLLRSDGKIIRTGLRYAGQAADGKVRICTGGRFTLKNTRDREGTLGSLGDFLRTFGWADGRNKPSIALLLIDPKMKVVITGGKWGYLTENGTVLIREKYEFGGNFDRGQAIVRMGGKWGVISASGDTVLNFRYSRIIPLPGSGGDHYLVSAPNEKQGYVHSSGQVRVEPDYKKVQRYSQGIAWVRNGRQFLAMDTMGQVLHQANYRDARPFGSGLAPVQVRGGWVYVSPEGDTAFGGKRFSKASSFSQGLAAAADRSGKLGYINEEGEWSIAPRYNQAAAFHPNGLAIVWKEGKCGLINHEGKEIVPCRHTRIREYACGRYVAQGSGGWTLLDSTGQSRKVPEEVSKVFDFREGLAVVLVNNKFGFIDTEGKMVIPPMYGETEGFCEGIAVCGRGPEKTAVDTGGREILKKARLTGSFSEGKGIMRLPGDSLCVFVDRSGQMIFGRSFQSAYPFENGVARVKEKGRWGLIDARGMVVLSPRFDAIGPMSEGMMSIRLDNWLGVADRKGQFIITPDYDNISAAGDGIFRVEHTNRMGYLDKHGKWLWPMSE